MIINSFTMAMLIAVNALTPTSSGVKFNHALHYTDNSIQCTDCHAVASSQLSSDKSIPGHDVCSDCHSTENAPEDCAVCHKNPDDPSGVTFAVPELIFSHKKHLKEPVSSELCLTCHTGAGQMTTALTSDNFPTMDKCFTCHDGSAVTSECSACHSRPIEMSEIVHPPDWEHEHRFATNSGGKECTPCHSTQDFCTNCHGGDNLVGNVHELNYRDSHGLDAKSNEYLCQSCHDPQTFCSSCHEAEGAYPLNHTKSDWALPPYTHADAALQDIESCASCHSSDSPICTNCHFDTDGIVGTNPPIHPADMDNLDHGPWHDDPGFQCFACHVSTNQPGVGFCGYCHGNK